MRLPVGSELPLLVLIQGDIEAPYRLGDSCGLYRFDQLIRDWFEGGHFNSPSLTPFAGIAETTLNIRPSFVRSRLAQPDEQSLVGSVAHWACTAEAALVLAAAL